MGTGEVNVDRRLILKDRRTVIVKLGSMVLASPDGGVDEGLIEDLAGEMAGLGREGYRFVIVSSGAILMGMQEMGRKTPPRAMKDKQALAAVGQSRLMHAYDNAFGRNGVKVGQMLLTRDGLEDRTRFVNSRNTLESLFKLDVVPVINENDSVAVDEIRFGDNDFLSSMVVNLTRADLLIIMTDIAGLYDKDPRLGEGKLVQVVDEVDERIVHMAGGPGEAGTGGMSTKVMAAKRTAHMGIPTIIADGRTKGNLTRILRGDPVGTLFMPGREKLASKKHWIAYSGGAKGTLVLDPGAVKAIVRDHKSLLPAGVVSVEGGFDQGALVRCVDGQGVEIARGVTCCSADQIRKIMGRQSREIETLLGVCPGEEVIHRDDLVLSDAQGEEE